MGIGGGEVQAAWGRGRWEAAGPQPQAAGVAREACCLRLSDLAGVPAQRLHFLLMSGGCLLSSGEKDVKLIPTLIKQPPD